MSRKKIILIIVSLLLMFSVACGSITNRVQEALSSAANDQNQPEQEEVQVQQQEANEDEEEVVEEAEVEEEEEAEVEEAQEQEEEQQAAPSGEAQDVVLEDAVSFIQEDTNVSVLFYLNNPNTEWAMEYAQAKIILYNDEEVVIDTTDVYVNFLLPGERAGIVTDIYIDEGHTVSSVEVQFNPGEFEPLVLDRMPFTVSKTYYLEGDWYPMISGIVESSLNTLATDIRVNVAAFDGDGTFVGGGYYYLDFVPANGYAAFQTYITQQGDVETIEVYPIISGLTSFGEEDYQNYLTLGQMGFSLDGQDVGMAFFVNNSDATKAVEYSIYQAAAYDAQGYVLDTDWGYIDYMFPGETQAVAPDLYIPEGQTVDMIEIQVMSGDLVDAPLASSPVTTDQANFLPDDWSPTVTGTFDNSSDKVYESFEVVAVLYDAAGNIIGGGYAYVDFIPANGSTAAEIWVTVDPTLEVANVEIYPTFSPYVLFED